MKSYRTLIFYIVLSLTTIHTSVNGQTSTDSNGNVIDEDLVDRWDSSLNFPGCYKDLANADKDGDGYVKQNEYLSFIQTYGERKCFATDKLTLQQSGVFIGLACICRDQQGSSPDCCLGDNAKISTAGSTSPPSQRTPTESDYLTSVCKLTDATIDSSCPPIVAVRSEPAVVVMNRDGTVPASAASSSGLEWWGWLLIAAAILFLLCCCCGFALRKRRVKENEEEKEEEVIFATTESKGITPKEMDPEQPSTTIPENGQAPRAMEIPVEPFIEDPVTSDEELLQNVPADVNPIIATTVARGGVIDDDSEEEEEERRKRGGKIIPDDNDPDRVIYRGGPGFPPSDSSQDPNKLRPIPPKEHEDDEWDQPGRNIEYPVEKDDMSAGEVEHYEPDGGVHWPERPQKDPLEWNRDWNRPKPNEPDDNDNRKHRIQTGLGEGEIFNKLDEESTHFTTRHNNNDAFDWVIQSALGAIGTDNNNNNSSHHNKNKPPMN